MTQSFPRFSVERPQAAAVLELLRTMNIDTLGADPGREEALNILASDRAHVVVTGQQAGLFLGPVFTLYKLISALRTADAIEALTGSPAVTLFWVQNEDHDLEEICRTAFPSRTGELIGLALDCSNASRRSVAYEPLPPDVTALIERAREELNHHAPAAELFSRLTECYRPGRTYSEAFTRLVAETFAGRRLLLFDARHPGVSALAGPIYRRALEHASEIEEKLHDESRRLRALGKPEQVHVRPGSPLFFVHRESAEGPRHRVSRHGEEWLFVGAEGGISDRDLRRLIDEHADRLSCTALLRPLLQDYLLQSACYIGGDAELRYFEQITPLYPLFELEQPRVYARAGFRIIEARERELLEAVSLAPEDLELSAEALAEKLARNQSMKSPEELFAEASTQLAVAFSLLVPEFERADRTLLDPLSKTRAKALSGLEGLKAKYAEALSRGSVTSASRITRLRSMLYPGGMEQERSFGSLYYLARYGRPFLERIEAEIVPFERTKKDVYL